MFLKLRSPEGQARFTKWCSPRQAVAISRWASLWATFVGSARLSTCPETKRYFELSSSPLELPSVFYAALFRGPRALTKKQLGDILHDEITDDTKRSESFSH